MSASPLIQVRNLTMGWHDSVLQQDLSFSVERGDIFAILGGSGCGKTTLLRHLIGLQIPLGGTIEINGVTACALAPLRAPALA